MVLDAATTLRLLRRHPRSLVALPHLLRSSISSSRVLLEQLDLSPASPDHAAAPGDSALSPPNPCSGSPFYVENWRNPAAANPFSTPP
ncbi:hypothetical protein E2562_033141 [Oryza meyeriana var. granulata]|uniref:Uncharacterized protein n=1 Tax=Oryza meyeriana var. granulata TaxID=110450 RepID=A0A6G1CJ02_9ORYZ|nr:hypothetical protein E2562_033141 [Oryza meyeriana var. granulata]